MPMVLRVKMSEPHARSMSTVSPGGSLSVADAAPARGTDVDSKMASTSLLDMRGRHGRDDMSLSTVGESLLVSMVMEDSEPLACKRKERRGD